MKISKNLILVLGLLIGSLAVWTSISMSNYRLYSFKKNSLRTVFLCSQTSNISSNFPNLTLGTLYNKMLTDVKLTNKANVADFSLTVCPNNYSLNNNYKARIHIDFLDGSGGVLIINSFNSSDSVQVNHVQVDFYGVVNDNRQIFTKNQKENLDLTKEYHIAMWKKIDKLYLPLNGGVGINFDRNMEIRELFKGTKANFTD